jgi:Fur family ferric uptake transcriptional regulator
MATTPPADLRAAWREAIHAAGLRVTVQRQDLLAAVWRLRHATPERLVADLGAAGSPMSLSTVYRGLEALEAIGLVRHAHLGGVGPTYHIAVESPHLHLRCNGCRQVTSLPPEVAGGFVAEVAQRTGFTVDITHGAVYGICAACAEQAVAGQEER